MPEAPARDAGTVSGSMLGQGLAAALGTQRRVERISQAVVTVPVRDVDAGFASVRSLVLQWFEDAAGHRLPAAVWDGAPGSVDGPGGQHLETVHLPEPAMWVARHEAPDGRMDGRSWITEAMLAPAGARVLRLGCRLQCATPGTPALPRSVPGFLRTVAREHEIHLDGVEIEPSAQVVETGDETDALVSLLADPGRRAPVVGVSMEEANGESWPLLDTDRLAEAVFGTAHVRLLTRPASFWLTSRIGKRLSVFNGAVRIWWPDLQPDDDPFDHPLWLAERIRDEEDTIRAAIADGLLHASVARRGTEGAMPSFAEARRAASTFVRAAAAGTGRPAADMVPLLEAETARLVEELRDAKAEQAELLKVADDELRRVTAERDEARAEVQALRERLVEAERAARLRERTPEIEIPDSFDGLGDWAARHLGGTVELLPRALSAAKKSAFDNPALAYQALLLLHDAYVPMRRTGGLVTKERWENGLRRLGLDCTATHAGARAGENPNDYFVTYGGRKVAIDMHLKGSSSRDPRYCFRLYFFWNEEKARVVVASLPSHLGTRLS